MSTKRFSLDGLLAAMRQSDDSAAIKPMKRIGAGVAKTRAAQPRYHGFPAFCVRAGLPEPVREHRFHPERMWRFDQAWPEYRVALEIEGAIWTNGGHSRGSGKTKDHEKFTAAACLGWRIIYCQPSALMTIATISNIRSAINYQHTKP